MFFNLPAQVAEKYITNYLASKSFEHANGWAKELSLHSSDLTEEHVKTIIQNAAKNDQIMQSFELGILLNKLRNQMKFPEEAFNSLLHSNGLAEYAPAIALVS